MHSTQQFRLLTGCHSLPLPAESRDPTVLLQVQCPEGQIQLPTAVESEIQADEIVDRLFTIARFSGSIPMTPVFVPLLSGQVNTRSRQ
ncbi:MAG: hypothetical protein OI74_06395 [Gammaproteobacteria bacterium (ex Lamellibrachia satsuma)]|nr:MAG: hypothetical protein OI74_06395 [Gammaproteobacteria bacterium (ex Lamellibrachia satsuma)]RRS37479.1 MAG: hypothetical protein NV67_00825 [Gammaproteobacteria bacterium (ex Lamellibrachia satsuma)]